MSSNHLYFIDHRVADIAHLVEALPHGSHWSCLPPGCDAPAHMVDILDLLPEVDTVHLLCHGSAGHLTLGGIELSHDTLKRHAPDLRAIGRRLGTRGEILLYGCETAAGRKGEHFVRVLSRIFDLPVAASPCPTGAAGQGGSWSLAFRTAPLRSVPLQVGSYRHTLAG